MASTGLFNQTLFLANKGLVAFWHSSRTFASAAYGLMEQTTEFISICSVRMLIWTVSPAVCKMILVVSSK